MKTKEKVPEIFRGKIVGFNGSWESGLGALVIENEDGFIQMVHCENGQTVRALENAFGNTITPGHTANGQGYKDKEIFWCYDEMGLIFGGFTPVDEASPELIEQYNKQKKARTKLAKTIKNRRRIINEVL